MTTLARCFAVTRIEWRASGFGRFVTPVFPVRGVVILHVNSFQRKREIGVMVRLEVSPIPCAVNTLFLRCPNKFYNLYPRTCGHLRALQSVSTRVWWAIPGKVVLDEGRTTDRGAPTALERVIWMGGQAFANQKAPDSASKSRISLNARSHANWQSGSALLSCRT